MAYVFSLLNNNSHNAKRKTGKKKKGKKKEKRQDLTWEGSHHILMQLMNILEARIELVEKTSNLMQLIEG